MTDVLLYDLPGCPYCAKVKRRLEDLEVPYETVAVPADRAERDEVERVSGQRGVPVLVDESNDITGMPESDEIVAYLERTYG